MKLTENDHILILSALAAAHGFDYLPPPYTEEVADVRVSELAESLFERIQNEGLEFQSAVPSPKPLSRLQRAWVTFRRKLRNLYHDVRRSSMSCEMEFCSDEANGLVQFRRGEFGPEFDVFIPGAHWSGTIDLFNLSPQDQKKFLQIVVDGRDEDGSVTVICHPDNSIEISSSSWPPSHVVENPVDKVESSTWKQAGN